MRHNNKREEDASESNEANKLKGKTYPTFNLASNTKVVIDIKHAMKEVIGGCKTTLQDLDPGTINVVGVKKINDFGNYEGNRSHYTRNHWARATTEAPAKFGEQQIPCIALMDHGLEINMMSLEFYAQ